MAEFLISEKQFLQAVARETARMSYPGRMGGVVKAGTKRAAECYFATEFPGEEVWKDAKRVAKRFDRWHRKRVQELGRCLQKERRIKRKRDRAEAVAAKFLNTYMHQLMKYEPCRPLWNRLHLPLDRRVLEELRRLKRQLGSRALEPVERILEKPPYSLTRSEYVHVQTALLNLLKTCRPGLLGF